jgi:uncharacterized protein YbjT (DUF2867 family)
MTPISQRRLLLVGATGMVGGYALRYSFESATARSVTAIVRRKLGISHPKLQEVLHGDFADCSSLSQVLSGQDAAVFCLGAYTGAVSDAELRRTTVDYTIEFARVLRGSSPNAAFSFLKRRACSPRLGQMAIVTTLAEAILECDSHTQMHVTNTAAIVYNSAHYAKSRNSVPRSRPGRHHYAESAG